LGAKEEATASTATTTTAATTIATTGTNHRRLRSGTGPGGGPAVKLTPEGGAGVHPEAGGGVALLIDRESSAG
jgi:hypothetical protein